MRFYVLLLISTSYGFLSIPNQGLAVNPFELIEQMTETSTKSNLDLQAKLKLIESAQLLIEPADKLPDPMLGISSGISSKGELGDRSIMLSQMFMLFGKRGLMTQMADLNLTNARYLSQIAELQLQTNIKLAVWNIYKIDRRLELIIEEKQLLANIIASVNAMYITGEASQANLLQAQLKLARTDEEVFMLNAERITFVQLLNKLTGQPTEIPQLESIAREIESIIDLKELITISDKHNPILKAMTNDIAMAKLNSNIQFRALKPDLELSVGFMQKDVPNMAEPMNMFSAGAGVSLPIWKNDVTSIAKSFQKQAEAHQLQLNYMQTELESEIATMHHELQALQNIIELYETGLIPMAESALQVALASYKSGELMYADLIESQQMLYELQMEHKVKTADFWMTIAKIEGLIGDNLKYKIKQQ